jgi:hypothetical protein
MLLQLKNGLTNGDKLTKTCQSDHILRATRNLPSASLLHPSSNEEASLNVSLFLIKLRRTGICAQTEKN